MIGPLPPPPPVAPELLDALEPTGFPPPPAPPLPLEVVAWPPDPPHAPESARKTNESDVIVPIPIELCIGSPPPEARYHEEACAGGGELGTPCARSYPLLTSFIPYSPIQTYIGDVS